MKSKMAQDAGYKIQDTSKKIIHESCIMNRVSKFILQGIIKK